MLTVVFLLCLPTPQSQAAQNLILVSLSVSFQFLPIFSSPTQHIVVLHHRFSPAHSWEQQQFQKECVELFYVFFKKNILTIRGEEELNPALFCYMVCFDHVVHRSEPSLPGEGG